MRIALDTNPLYTARAGVARYVRGLEHGLHHLAPGAFECLPLAWPVENLGYAQPLRGMRTWYRECLWSRFAAPRLLATLAPDLLHITSNLRLADRAPCPSVTTLYDLAALRCPARFRPWQRASWSATRANLEKSSRIICISRFTADEATALLSIPSARLEVIHCGADFMALSSTRPEPPRIALPSEFFLFVGSLEPGKNLRLLKSAYEQARAMGHPLPPLLVVGTRWAGVPDEGPPPADWVYTGWIPDSQLLHLYRSTIALVFPSQYEGFGLPVAEAMAEGCPVIASRVASLPEVGGDAVLWTETMPDAYRKAMSNVATDAPMRDALRRAGPPQAARFTWKRTAEDTLALYANTQESP